MAIKIIKSDSKVVERLIREFLKENDFSHVDAICIMLQAFNFVGSIMKQDCESLNDFKKIIQDCPNLEDIYFFAMDLSMHVEQGIRKEVKDE